jgi:ribosomal protein S18 acetylase RimI-like enzyme
MQLSELADLLEKHEETSNAESARRIGGEIWDRGDALVFSSRTEFGSGLNFACRVRSDESHIEKLIDEVDAWFALRSITPHFRVSPLTRPAHLAQLLKRRGFARTETEMQMVLAGEDIEPPTRAAPRITIKPIETHELERWAEIQSRGFGMKVSPAVIELARVSAERKTNSLYLARLDGEPVAAGTLIEWAGALGIYGVATLPKARNHRVGTALVRQMIRDARARGDSPICLQAETDTDTQRWYERLGFRVVYDRTGWTKKTDGCAKFAQS